jgi:hypothetical protein
LRLERNAQHEGDRNRPKESREKGSLHVAQWPMISHLQMPLALL